MNQDKKRWTVEWVLDTEATTKYEAVRIAIEELRKVVTNPISVGTAFVVSESSNQDEISIINSVDAVEGLEDIDVWEAFAHKKE